MIKKILHISFAILILCGVLFLLAFANKSRENVVCKQLNINVINNQDIQFVDYQEIEKTFSEQGIKIEGNEFKNIEIPKLEKILNAHPHIKKADVYAEINGDINITILQRKPILRIFNTYNESYYMDEDGWLMPLSNKHSPRIPVANGLIFEKYSAFYKINFADTVNRSSLFKNTFLDDLFLIAKAIENDSLWQKQIQQIYVDKEIELIPRVGQQQIILGDGSNLQEKLNKLKIFYTEATPKIGWNKYSIINLKFKNQVVCTKSEN